MDWNKKIILPEKSPVSNPNRFHSTCPALIRFFGSIGFTSCGLGVLYLGQYLFKLKSDIWETSHWEIKTVLLLVISVVAGLVGGLIGAGIGLSINVTSKRVNYILHVLWHYLAMGSIFWYLLLTLYLNKIYGASGIKQFMNQIDKTSFIISTVLISIGGSLLIATILLITGLLKEDVKPKLVYCALLAMPVSLGMWYFQFNFLAINTGYWIMFSLIFPFVLILTSTYMINRDKEQRRHILENGRK